MTSCAILSSGGCQSAPRNVRAVESYYQYEFTDARQALRGAALTMNDEQVILNNARLGLAALADGDLREAELGLGKSFELLSTAGLNQDRTVAAVLVHEGVKIWKGEPFEQALMYHWTAALYAVLGDWENMRAAAINGLFRLTDFGADQNAESLVKQAAENDEFLDQGYTAVDTNFALGFLMEAIGADLSGASGSNAQFDAALKINPDLAPLVETLRSHQYNTLLIVDYGKGPTKIAYGMDDALVQFIPQESPHGPLVVENDSGGKELARFTPVCDVNVLAQDMRWNNLEDIRRAKSILGTALMIAGSEVASSGGRHHSGKKQLVGLGMIAAGLLSKSGAKADTRYLEFSPQSVYLTPLLLNKPSSLRLSVEGAGDAINPSVVLNDISPGKAGNPAVFYVRLHGPDSPTPPWLNSSHEKYGNDHTGVQPGDGPWILGGRDVSTPSRTVLAAYQKHGYLLNFTLEDLDDLYRAEGIHIGSGMENEPGVRRNPSFRHILEGGTGLFTPAPGSMGYKRLMHREHPPYSPKSELVRNEAARFRVHQTEPPPESPRFREP